jgi:hypothetical protein
MARDPSLSRPSFLHSLADIRPSFSYRQHFASYVGPPGDRNKQRQAGDMSYRNLSRLILVAISVARNWPINLRDVKYFPPSNVAVGRPVCGAVYRLRVTRQCAPQPVWLRSSSCGCVCVPLTQAAVSLDVK